MILITGGSGFLGLALRRFMTGEFRRHRRENLEMPGHNFRFFNFDYPNHSILDKDPAWRHPDRGSFPTPLDDLDHKVSICQGVFHLAAVANLNHSLADPTKNWLVNVIGTENVAAACAKHGKLLIFASTCCVYGNHPDHYARGQVLTEEAELLPAEPYAKSKSEAEGRLAERAGLKYRVARLGTLYGPGMREALFNSIALRAGLMPEGRRKIQMHGGGDQSRMYIHIDDAVRGLWIIFEKGINGQAYNVCGDEEITVRETIARVQNLTGGKLDIESVPDRPGQILKERISNERLKRLGWRPRVDYAEGMARTLEWLRPAREPFP